MTEIQPPSSPSKRKTDAALLPPNKRVKPTLTPMEIVIKLGFEVANLDTKIATLTEQLNKIRMVETVLVKHFEGTVEGKRALDDIGLTGPLEFIDLNAVANEVFDQVKDKNNAALERTRNIYARLFNEQKECMEEQVKLKTELNKYLK